MGQSLLALTVYYGKKMDDRKNLASSASPHEIALVYPVLKEYSPVTEEHNGSAGSHGEDKIVTYWPSHQGTKEQSLAKSIN